MKNWKNYAIILALLFSTTSITLTLSGSVKALPFMDSTFQNRFNQAITIPPIKGGDNAYINMQPSSPRTCIDLEVDLGVSRGTIEQIQEKGDGSMVIKYSKGYVPTQSQLTAIETLFSKTVKEVTITDPSRSQ